MRQGLGVQVKGLGVPLSYGLVKFIRQINNRVVMYKLEKQKYLAIIIRVVASSYKQGKDVSPSSCRQE
jgi:hypothetical protein